MSIFEPRFDFIVTSLVFLILLIRIRRFDCEDLKKFPITLVTGIILILPFVLHLFPHLPLRQVHLAIEFGLFGIVFGLIFNNLFIKMDTEKYDDEEREKRRLNINKRKKSVQQKLPILFAVVWFTIQNKSENRHLAELSLVLAPCAYVLYLSVKGQFSRQWTILLAFTVTILFQFLLSYNEITQSIATRITEMMLWTASLVLIYVFEDVNKGKKIDN